MCTVQHAVIIFLYTVPIETIREIRVGRNTENLRNSESCFEELAEDCAFSVIWSEEYQCLDLIANSPDEANIWVTGLVALTSGNRKEELSELRQSLSVDCQICSLQFLRTTRPKVAERRRPCATNGLKTHSLNWHKRS